MNRFFKGVYGLSKTKAEHLKNIIAAEENRRTIQCMWAMRTMTAKPRGNTEFALSAACLPVARQLSFPAVLPLKQQSVI
jgi:hypothetical protein